MSSFTIKQIGIECINEQVDLFRESFGIDDDVEKLVDFWFRKHYSNPNGNSYIFAAYDGDLIIGINAFIPVNYKFGENVFKFVQSCDSGVRPEYRRKGVWKNIIKTATDFFIHDGSFDAMIGFPNYKNSYNGFMELGWKQLGNMSNYILIVDGTLTVQAFAGEKKWTKLFKFAGTHKYINYIISNSKYQINMCDINELDELQQIDNKCCLKIDRNIMLWKCECKNLELFSAKVNGNIVAFFLGCEQVLDGNYYYEINRIFAVSENKNEIAGAFRQFVKIICMRKKYSFIRGWGFQNQLDARIYKHSYFIKTNFHPNPFIIFYLRNNTDLFALDNIENWDVSFFDLD